MDPAKFDFYAMDCYRSVGEDGLALAAAETVRRSSMTPSGLVVAPMRLAEAELTQATVYACAGEVEQAMLKAEDAFARARRSLPSILLVGHEVAGVMQRTRPDSSATADFAEHLRALEAVA